MTSRITLLTAMAITLTTAACRKATDNPVPRPEAYPRIEAYEAAYDSITAAGGLVVPVNKGAVSEVARNSGKSQWINLSYPRYRATLRYTITTGSARDVKESVDNRLTRMSLNSGGNTTEIIELRTPEGIASTIFVTPGATVTPLQILSTDSATFTMSGVLEIASPTATREEIMPVVAAVKEDLLYTAKHIARQ